MSHQHMASDILVCTCRTRYVCIRNRHLWTSYVMFRCVFW